MATKKKRLNKAERNLIEIGAHRLNELTTLQIVKIKITNFKASFDSKSTQTFDNVFSSVNEYPDTIFRKRDIGDLAKRFCENQIGTANANDEIIFTFKLPTITHRKEMSGEEAKAVEEVEIMQWINQFVEDYNSSIEETFMNLDISDLMLIYMAANEMKLVDIVNDRFEPFGIKVKNVYEWFKRITDNVR